MACWALPVPWAFTLPLNQLRHPRQEDSYDHTQTKEESEDVGHAAAHYPIAAEMKAEKMAITSDLVGTMDSNPKRNEAHKQIRKILINHDFEPQEACEILVDAAGVIIAHCIHKDDRDKMCAGLYHLLTVSVADAEHDAKPIKAGASRQ